MTKPPNATGRWPAAIIAVSLAAAVSLDALPAAAASSASFHADPAMQGSVSPPARGKAPPPVLPARPSCLVHWAVGPFWAHSGPVETIWEPFRADV